MIEGTPTDLREYAIARTKRKIAQLKEQITEEEGKLNQLVLGRAPIQNGQRAPFQRYLQEVTGVTKFLPNIDPQLTIIK